MTAPPAQRPQWHRGQVARLTPRFSCLPRRRLLPVHGHALSRLHQFEESKIPGEAGARVHSQFQTPAGVLQADECG